MNGDRCNYLILNIKFRIRALSNIESDTIINYLIITYLSKLEISFII